MIINVEKQFLIIKRQLGRPGCFSGIDKNEMIRKNE